MDNNVNIALIGPGRMGVNYAKVIIQNPNARLVAICGNTVANTEKNAASFSVPLYFNNAWNEMFANHPEIDTVLITTSEWAHLEPFKAALQHGKNIIIEKPVAVDPASYEEMEILASLYPSLKILVCFTCRFDNRYLQAKKFIDSNDFGKIGYIYSRRNADVKTASRILGKFPTPYWIIVHDIDLMRWITGSEVLEVSAVESSISNKGNFLSVRLLFENGVAGVIESTFYSEPVSGQDHTRMDIECEKGKIELKLSDSGVNAFHSVNGIETPDVNDFVDIHGQFTGNTPVMINHFIEVLRDKIKPVVNFSDGLTAVKISKAIQQSIELRSSVSISDHH
jgi:UDP-N-acetylglucosamine 3-dehydrogenase